MPTLVADLVQQSKRPDDKATSGDLFRLDRQPDQRPLQLRCLRQLAGWQREQHLERLPLQGPAVRPGNGALQSASEVL